MCCVAHQKCVFKKMTLLLFISALFTYLCSVTGQTQCNPGEICGSLFDCQPLFELTKDLSPANTQLLQKAFCGYTGNTPLVCCPPKVPSCRTPDNAPGSCISLYSCPHLMATLTPPISQTALEYVQRSRCEGPERYSVCCGAVAPTPTTTIPPSPKPFTASPDGQCTLTALPPDPSTECCGLDSGGGGNRIVGGNVTAIDEYPWLAIIEYVKDFKIKLLCGGVLISGRYVMTASHCVAGPVLNVGKPTNVRLGEYDTSKSGPDCVDVAGGGTDCTNGERIVPIEKIIPHPEYNPQSKLRRHDIALIRLAQTVEYTDFIRPVCLPTADFTEAPPEDVMLHVAGWGAVNDTKSSSNIKLAVTLPYVSYQDCQPSYTVPSRRVTLWDGQICAGGVVGKDSCKGDSGGPLIRENGRIMELVGIVSFGPTPCGMENVAGVYTKVYKYLPWIRSNMEP